MEQFTPITHSDIQTMSEMSKASILVWLKLRIYAGHNGKAYPTRAKVAEDLNMSIYSINRAFQDLEARKMITKLGHHAVIKNAQYVIKNDQSLSKNDQSLSKNDQSNRSKMLSGTDQKCSAALSNSDYQNKEGNTSNNKASNIACSKGNNSFAFERAASSAAQVEALDGSDERDLWLAELWAKHATTQGWTSEDVPKDFAMIKEGLEVIQVAKVVRKLDAYIEREQCNGIYQGKGWSRKIRDRWCAKENKKVTDYDRKKMRESTIMIGQEKQQAEKEAQEHQEQIRRAAAVSKVAKSKAAALWADFVARFHNYEERANAVFEWRRKGGLTDEIRKEIKADPDLFDFDMLCDVPLYPMRGEA